MSCTSCIPSFDTCFSEGVITSISGPTCTPVCFPSSFAVSTFVSLSSITINLSTYNCNITNNQVFYSTTTYYSTTNYYSTIYLNYSTTIENWPSTLSTNAYVTNWPSTLSTNAYVTNWPSTLSVNAYVTNWPSTLSTTTYITNSNLSVNAYVTNWPSTLSVNSYVSNWPSTLSVNSYVTNWPSTLSVNSYVTNWPSTISTVVIGGNFTISIGSTISTTGTISVKNILTDVFNRVYVNSPTTILATLPCFTPQYELLDYKSTGTGFISTVGISSLTVLQVSGNGGRAIRQTREYQIYQPGNSHLIQFTMTPQFLGTFDSSVAIRAGLFDDYRDKNTPAGTTGAPPYLYRSSINGGTGKETDEVSMGHFFELSGNSWFVVERYNSPDNLQNVSRIPQSNWNVDPLNGSGPSRFTLQKNSTSLFFIERQWLGVGVVRMGVFQNTLFTVCHVFENRIYNMPYTHLNKLPIRYEIEKLAGGSSNTAVFASICASSHIGANYVPYGRIYSIPANLIFNTVRIGITDLRPVLLIRLQQKFCRATFKLKDIEMFGVSPGGFSVLLNPILGGTPATIAWTPHPSPGSIVEYAYFPDGNTSTRTVTGGTCIRSGFYSTRIALQDSLGLTDLLTVQSFSSDIAGEPDVLCVAMVSFTPNNDVNANARWIELV